MINILEGLYPESEISQVIEQFFNKPKKMILRAMILNHLSIKDNHGYNLLKKIKEKTKNHWVPSHSMLYNELFELEAKNMIKSKIIKKGEKILKCYNITLAGKEELRKLAFSFLKLFDFGEYGIKLGYHLKENLLNELEFIVKKLPNESGIKKIEEFKLLLEKVLELLDNKLKILKRDD